MKITPDYEGRNDEYDDNTVRFYEKIEPDGYFYELYVLIDGKKARIVVTEGGVSVDYHLTGETLFTKLVPEKLFPDLKSLSWNELHKIIKILRLGPENVGGTLFPKEEMESMYERWLKTPGAHEEAFRENYKNN